VCGAPISAQDYPAMVCKALGTDWTKEYLTREGRPMRLQETSAKLPRRSSRSRGRRPCHQRGDQRWRAHRRGNQRATRLRDYEPAPLFVVEHVRPRYAGRHRRERVALAGKPAQQTDKGVPAPGLLAQAVASKDGEDLPPYRLERTFARHGVGLSPASRNIPPGPEHDSPRCGRSKVRVPHRTLSAPGDRRGVANARVARGRPSQPPQPRVMR